MKKSVLTILLSLFLINVANATVKLQHQGSATQIVVNGKPMLILGGELSNSAASSIADIDSVMPLMARLGHNTVFVPAYWDLIEPNEGKFDFSLIDEVINKARENNLKVIFLWFGAWKNSMSCYAPVWFKQNASKYPRAMTKNGKPLEIASCFSEDVLNADNRAFARLMQHIADTDSKENTVIMMQIENEIGMLEDARDHSKTADKLFNAAVPNDLVTYLKANRSTLHPKMADKLKAQSADMATLKSGLTWQQMFGSDVYTDEIFMAYYYARYVEHLALTARKIHNIPLYVNAAMNSRGRKPGEYPSAGPLAHLIDVWHCAAPDIDVLAPDLYDTNFKGWVAQYKLPNNFFFTPETRLSENSGVRALYTFGELDAMGFSTFAIDEAPYKVAKHVEMAYSLIDSMMPLLLRCQGKGLTHGLLFDKNDKERVINDGETVLTCRHYFTLPWDPRAKDGSEWAEGGGLIVKLADDEYIIAGNGIVVTFTTKSEKEQEEKKTLGEDGFVNKGTESSSNAAQQQRFTGKRLGIGYVDEVTFDASGNMKYLRRENGDQDHQGRHARIPVTRLLVYSSTRQLEFKKVPLRNATF
jgi:hypothetical protein